MRTATLIRKWDYDVYMLQRLSIENSWRLFEMSAFNTSWEDETCHELVDIGKNIVEKCSGNPLAIKMVGNLLLGQPISKWQSVLANVTEGHDGILPTLKLSYHNLESSTKSCFKYCAIFPKDVRIQKEKLIGLWIAQGYVVTSHIGESIEDVAEKHFLNMLDRCFFEDVVKDEYGDIESFKINTLMYEVAQEVGREEVCTITSNMNCLGNMVRHVHNVGHGSIYISLHGKKVRSYVDASGPSLDKHIDKWMSLRVLDLCGCEFKILPDSLGKLLHLRYLDLSHCKNLELLCDSITQLYNLQVLDLHNCDQLTCMPSGMDKLINLRVLPLFVVGNGMSSGKMPSKGMFKDLESLRKIKGKICIKVGANCKIEEGINNEGRCLKSMKYLRDVKVEFKDVATCAYNPEIVLDKLEPPANIKGFFLHNYKGTRIGRWGRAHHNWPTSFPHLVHIVVWKCGNLQQMPLLSKLPFLKTLSLFCLDSLEYMEYAMSSDKEVENFFPSLETLEIMWMERLKGWWKMDSAVEKCVLSLRLRFPSLLYLKIFKCPNLMSFAPYQIPGMMVHEFPSLRSLKIANCPNLVFNFICPTIKTLELRDVNERSQIACGNSQDGGKCRHAEVDRVRHLKPVRTYSLSRLCIHGDLEVDNLSEVKECFSELCFFAPKT